MFNYIVVLFKNKKRKRILNKFVELSNAIQYYEKKIKESSEVIFNVEYENGKNCKYDISIISLTKNESFPMYYTDEMGRNIRIYLEDDDMSIVKISQYNKEEKIFDIQKNKKITSNQLLRNYLSGSELKIMSVLNNKVIVQKDELFSIFSLKSESESLRFIDSISKHFFKIKRTDCIFVNDTSSPQKKYLIKLLNENGVDKKILYRKFTTYPR
jgi:hypothetical protein